MVSKKSGIKSKKLARAEREKDIKSGPFQRLQDVMLSRGKCPHGKRIAKYWNQPNGRTSPTGKFAYGGRRCSACIARMDAEGFPCIESEQESLEKDLADSLDAMNTHHHQTSALSDAIEKEIGDEDEKDEQGFGGFEKAIKQGTKNIADSLEHDDHWRRKMAQFGPRYGIGGPPLTPEEHQERVRTLLALNMGYQDKHDEITVIQNIVSELQHLEEEGALDRVMAYLVSRYMPG